MPVELGTLPIVYAEGRTMRAWTKDSLQQMVAERMGGYRFIAVSNREPYIHEHRNGRIECIKPASGLTTAIDPIMRASGGVWIAHGSGTADRIAVDNRHHVHVPPEDPAYNLRRVWLSAEIEREYYYGLANEGIWPLCHMAFHRPLFRRRDWESYRLANELFAEAVLEEANGYPAFVFIQDYHFALLPRILKRADPRLMIAQFWHIPWPNNETFRIFPWKRELLEGLLGNDLLGFQLPCHCSNFLETINSNLEAHVDQDRSCVSMGEYDTAVRAFPISIDFDDHVRTASGPEMPVATAEWRVALGHVPEILGIGIDRIDYTKGIPERLEALALLFEEHPEYIGKLTLVQVGVPSRTAIPDYRRLNNSLCKRVDEINLRWAFGSWKPIVLIRRHVDQKALTALHLMADFCIVSALHDGMNLVAKEFVASRIDQDGVLILSAFAGAARELTDALIVNPFATDELAGAIHRAITMAPSERQRRMVRMREVVAVNNAYRWAAKFVLALSTIGKSAACRRSHNASEREVDAEVA
jgi:trehalose-6-phosphate synthase